MTPQADYHFHFPDGNASIARLLVRSLVPGSAPGNTAEDIVTAKMDYSRIDVSDSPVRIRLNSTAVAVHHVGDSASAKEVEVAYAREGKVYSVRGKGSVLACWNMVIPYICPDLPSEQRKRCVTGSRCRWCTRWWLCAIGMRSASLGSEASLARGCTILRSTLTRPSISVTTNLPDHPMTRSWCACCVHPASLDSRRRDQQRAGHDDLLTTSFETFERNIRDQLARVLGRRRIRSARDIDAITVNRWPHGYAYEYNPLWDPDWPEGQRPCEIARRRFGRITIANSDAAAAAYTDQAIDQAYRAVRELVETGKAISS